MTSQPFQGTGRYIATNDLRIAVNASITLERRVRGGVSLLVRQTITVAADVDFTKASTSLGEWRDAAERMDLVTARALAPLPVVAEYAAPLLRLGGALLAWRGRRDPEEEAATARAADQLGLSVRESRRVQPYPGAVNRHLQLLVKTSPTPPRFPRRPGMARKRPLGS